MVRELSPLMVGSPEALQVAGHELQPHRIERIHTFGPDKGWPKQSLKWTCQLRAHSTVK